MAQRRVLVVIDGSNLYFSLRRIFNKKISLSDFDYAAFVQAVIGFEPDDKVSCVGEILLARTNTETKKFFDSQQRLFHHLKSSEQLFRLQLGYLLKTDSRFHEKGVDTLIVIELLVGAYENRYDVCYLFSSDSDFIPAIKKVHAMGKEIVYVGFRGNISHALLHSCAHHVLLDAAWFDSFLKSCYSLHRLVNRLVHFFTKNSPSGQQIHQITAMSSPIMQAMKQIADEKGIKVETVLDAIEQALAAAYRKDFGTKNQNIFIAFDAETGGMKATDHKTIVPDMDLEEITRLDEEENRLREEALARGEEPPAEDPNRPRFNPKTEIMISEAKKLQGGVSIGDELILPLEIPTEFGRMAAMTAKQVITQKLREAERLMIYEEYKDKVGEIVQGTVQRREGRNFLVDFGRFSVILPPEEQIIGEFLRPGARVKVYIVSCTLGNRGPEIIVSRSHPNIVRRTFEQEIPEIQNNIVEIKAIAREGGSRSKVAVFTSEEGVDPIGACIGQRGTRIQTIIAELGGEKVDIILWSAEPREFITNALSPAKVVDIALDEEQKIAVVTVPGDQFSLAIGKGGQNVRLAAKLTGWTITVRQAETETAEIGDAAAEESEVEPPAEA